VLGAVNRGWEVWGIERGFEGLLTEDGVKPLDRVSVRGIIHTGGTILGTSNRGNPFRLRREEGGKESFVDVSQQVVDQFHALGLDALVVIGGDGTLTIANQLAGLGVPVVGVIPLATRDVLTATNLNRMSALLDHPLLGPAYNDLARACLPGRDLAAWVAQEQASPSVAETVAAEDAGRKRGLFRR